jgi:hypothetical protein
MQTLTRQQLGVASGGAPLRGPWHAIPEMVDELGRRLGWMRRYKAEEGMPLRVQTQAPGGRPSKWREVTPEDPDGLIRNGAK